MATERFVPAVKIGTLDDLIEAQLGTSGQKWSDADIGKALKLSSTGSYVLASKNSPAGSPAVPSDDIEAILVSVEPYTVNGGFSFGTIRSKRRVVAKVATGSDAVTVGAEVVADDQLAVGTSQDGRPLVRAANGVKFRWRCIWILSGTGAAGDLILIERI